MKKIILLGLGFCLIAFVTLTSFDSEKTGYEAQMEEIDELVQEELDVFRLEKEDECKERALVEAMPLAEEKIAAMAKGTTKRPTTASRPSRPTTTTSTPTTSTPTTTTTTYTPPKTTTTTTVPKKGGSNATTTTGAIPKKGGSNATTTTGTSTSTTTTPKKPRKGGGN